jgi:AcrR family transcriptional regulator
MRLLEKGGLDALTTNAVAASAGVSVGTLYQFFPNKEAILDTLADREIADMSARVMHVMEDTAIATTEARIARILGAVAASYGARHAAHRLVMMHSLTRGGGNRLSPLMTKLIAHLSNERQSGAVTRAIRGTDAFVLAHALAGVLRAMISEGDTAPPQEEIAQALTRLVLGLVQ